MTGILSSVPATRTVDTSVAMDKIPEWFPGARLNYAENLLRWAHLRRNDVELILPRRRFIVKYINVSSHVFKSTHRLGTCVLLPRLTVTLLQVSR